MPAPTGMPLKSSPVTTIRPKSCLVLDRGYMGGGCQSAFVRQYPIPHQLSTAIEPADRDCQRRKISLLLTDNISIIHCYLCHYSRANSVSFLASQTSAPSPGPSRR